MLRFSLQTILPLAPISRLGSSKTIFHFDYSSERFMAFTELSHPPSSGFYGARPESVETRDVGGRVQEGSESGLFHCPFLALREFKLLPVASRAWDRYWIFFVTLSFYILAPCDTVARSASSSLRKSPHFQKWDPKGELQ